MLDIYTVLNKSNKIIDPWTCYYMNDFIEQNEINQLLTKLFQYKPETKYSIDEKNHMFGIDGKWTYKPGNSVNQICPEIQTYFTENMESFLNYLKVPIKKYELNIEFANLSPGFKYEIHNDSKKKKASFVIYLTDDSYTEKDKEKLSTFLYDENFDQITNISAEPGRLTYFTPISRKCFHNMENNTRFKNRFVMVVNYMDND